MPWNAVDPMGLDAYPVGDALRSIGWDRLGDYADNFVDGAEVVADTIRGNPGAAARGAAKGALVGGALGYLITEGIAATGPAAPYVGAAVFAVGTLYAIHQVDQLGKNWNNLSEEEQAERLGEFGGGLFGGMIGYKVARPTRAMPSGGVRQTFTENAQNARRLASENPDNPSPPDVREFVPVKDPAPPIYREAHPGKPVVDHILARKAGGHPTDPANLRTIPWEMNARKGGLEGELLSYERFLIRHGLTPQQARSITEQEWKALGHDALPRPMDPCKLDRIPAKEY
jgi:hypothetical protein